MIEDTGHEYHEEPDSTDIELSAYWVQPSKWTFQADTVRNWLMKRLQGRVLNACCGVTKLDYDGEMVRNDLDESIDADYHYRVRDLPDIGIGTFDTIIYDPPWSDYQSLEEYGGRKVHRPKIAAIAFRDLLNTGGRLISFGYTTTPVPGYLGFETKEIAIFRMTGYNNDFFGVVSQRNNTKLSDYA